MEEGKAENETSQSKSTIHNKDKIDFDGLIPEEILEAIPEEDRGKFSSIISQTVFSGIMRRQNPISDKITTEHITQLIAKSDDQDRRDREERKGERNHNLILIIIILLFIGFLLILLQTNEELLIKVIIAIISFVGGFGFGKTKKTKDE